ncbi:MAG: YceI family protein [Acidiferrobacterales bacterium]|nr:YceI family protein [Acidiferrobacterales bacterium]
MGWSIDERRSSISFVSIKKNNIGETHSFANFYGTVHDGMAYIAIKPDSVDSRVPIRNLRMRDFLFKTNVYPMIRIKSNVTDVLEAVNVGESETASVVASVKLHGIERDVNMNIRVSKLSDHKMVVTSTHPILISAADFGMASGIRTLSKLVNGLTIAENVPVSFSLLFQQ